MSEPLKNVNYLVVHCSDTPNFRPDTIKDVHKWHLDKGWDGVGYHAVIDVMGKIWGGRPEFWQGSHVKAHNFESLGVCLIGKDRFTPLQMDSLKEWIISQKRHYPHAKVVGHCDVDVAKSCPNFDVKAWYNKEVLGLAGK